MGRFKFGDVVLISESVSFRYPEFEEEASNYKGRYVNKGGSKSEGIVLRKTRKATGYYDKGVAYASFSGQDPEPPSLSIDKWYPVYVVAIKPHGTLIFAEENAIEPQHKETEE